MAGKQLIASVPATHVFSLFAPLSGQHEDSRQCQDSTIFVCFGFVTRSYGVKTHLKYDGHFIPVFWETFGPRNREKGDGFHPLHSAHLLHVPGNCQEDREEGHAACEESGKRGG